MLSCAFGGALLLVAMVRGGDPGTGGLLGPSLGMRGILIAAALSYRMLSLLLRGQFAHTRTGGELQELTLSRQGRSVTVLALRDTGNTLQDPVTGRPVVVIEGEKLQTLVPELPVLDRQSLSHPVDLLRDLEGELGGLRLQLCPTGRWGWSAVCCWPCGCDAGPGLWPLGVPELFDRPLSHPAVRWGRILRPHIGGREGA